jgi:hypothetical protein
MLPADSQTADASLPLPAALYVTVHPDAMRPQALAGVQLVLGVGPKANDVVASLYRAIGAPLPPNLAATRTAKSCRRLCRLPRFALRH